MNRDDALADLTERLEARLGGVAMVSIANGNSPRIPAEMSAELAKTALEWAEQAGLSIDG